MYHGFKAKTERVGAMYCFYHFKAGLGMPTFNTLVQGCTTQNWCWVSLIGAYNVLAHIQLNPCMNS